MEFQEDSSMQGYALSGYALSPAPESFSLSLLPLLADPKLHKKFLIRYFEGFTFQGLLLAQGPLLLMLNRPYYILDIESENSMYKASVLIFVLFLHSLPFHF